MMRADLRRFCAILFTAAILACAGAQGTGGASSPLIAQAASRNAVTGVDILRLQAEGKVEEARRLGMARVIVDKTDIDAYVGLAWSLLSLGRYADAETWASRGYDVRKDPRLADAIGEAAYFLGKNDLALERLEEYLGAFPEGSRAGTAYYYCGETYIRLARYMHADISLSAALQYNPNNPTWWARLGWARESAGKLFQALKAYEKALSIDPRHTDAIAGKSRISARLRE